MGASNRPTGAEGTTVDKDTANALLEILATISRHVAQGTRGSHEDHGETSAVSADLLDFNIMRMQQIIEAASESLEERQAREAREDLGEEAYYRG